MKWQQTDRTGGVDTLYMTASAQQPLAATTPVVLTRRPGLGVVGDRGDSYLEESASGETTGRPLLRDGPHEIGDMSALAHFADSSRTSAKVREAP